jgi:hypothetical protein
MLEYIIRVIGPFWGCRGGGGFHRLWCSAYKKLSCVYVHTYVYSVVECTYKNEHVNCDECFFLFFILPAHHHLLSPPLGLFNATTFSLPMAHIWWLYVVATCVIVVAIHRTSHQNYSSADKWLFCLVFIIASAVGHFQSRWWFRCAPIIIITLCNNAGDKIYMLSVRVAQLLNESDRIWLSNFSVFFFKNENKKRAMEF